jgi:hypothetical protein
MAVFTLEDAIGGVEIVVFPEAYAGGGLYRKRYAGPRAR